MSDIPTSPSQRLSRAGAAFRRSPIRPSGTAAFAIEPPLRAELFSREQLAHHGRVLAGSHRLSARRGTDGLLGRLAENEAVLVAVRGLLGRAVDDERRITPAGEWLLDNFYLVEEQIRTARRADGNRRRAARAGMIRAVDARYGTVETHTLLTGSTYTTWWFASGSRPGGWRRIPRRLLLREAASTIERLDEEVRRRHSEAGRMTGELAQGAP